MEKQNEDGGLLNWNPSKGNPYDYDTFDYKDTISVDTQWEISECETKLKPVKTISLCHSLKTLASMDLKHTELLSGICVDEHVFHFDEKDIDCSKEITIWLDYPFSKKVKVTIYPIVRTFDGGGKGIILEEIGYVMWQISRVYAEIYKNHWESVGIWGHGFGDLYLEQLIICKDNIIDLAIGS